MTGDIVARLASAVAERLRTLEDAPGAPADDCVGAMPADCDDDAVIAALANSIIDELERAAASGDAGALPGEELEGLMGSLGEADIEAIASQLADMMAPLLHRDDLPADKVQI